MPTVNRLPNQVQFLCGTCLRAHAPRHIRRYRGECLHCGGRIWTLVASYVDAEINAGSAMLGLLSATTLGVGWASGRVETTQDTFDGIPAEHIYHICDSWFYVKHRAAGYIVMRVAEDAARERQSLIDRGATLCDVCGIFYMPADDKPWTRAGCCSKGCFAKRHPGQALLAARDSGDNSQPKRSVSAIGVSCRCGHAFDVPRTFAGLSRPCPKCGAKVPVPA
jgi:hypothetical protein